MKSTSTTQRSDVQEAEKSKAQNQIACFFLMCITLSVSLINGPLSQAQQQAESQPTIQPDVEAVLIRMEKAGEGLKDLTVKVKYTVQQLIKENPDDPDELQNYYGTVFYLKNTETAQSKIHFEKWDDGRTINRQQEWYLFDGRWLVEAKEKTKAVIKRELVGEEERIDPFKLGEGPIPLPFGQKRADIERNFNLQFLSPAEGDPTPADHLVCLPKNNTSLADQYDRIELWISNDTSSASLGFPVKIILQDRKEASLKSATFSEFRKNKNLTPQDFSLPSTTDRWEVIVEPRTAPKKP